LGAAFLKEERTAMTMPHELSSKDQAKALLKDALEVRVVRKNDSSKLKLRTKKGLYTFKTTEEEIESLIKGIKTPVVEF
jgi:ribosomal L38e-like protein